MTDRSYIAYVMSVNGPYATAFGESEDEAYYTLRDQLEQAGEVLKMQNICTAELLSCDHPLLGRCWHDTPQQLNAEGINWQFADNDPTHWPLDAVGYYCDIYTGNPAIFVLEQDQ